jgi:hypothetical protein
MFDFYFSKRVMSQTEPSYLSNYFLDLSGFKFLSQSQKLEYQQSWRIFNAVQLSNIKTSTLRAEGNQFLTYYQFKTNEENTFFTRGQSLHTFSYPITNWASVPEN